MPNKTQANKNNNKKETIEAILWKSADKLRMNMNAAEYKHVALGLIFLKYISDAFDGLHYKLVKGEGDYEGADPEDPDNISPKRPRFSWTMVKKLISADI